MRRNASKRCEIEDYEQESRHLRALLEHIFDSEEGELCFEKIQYGGDGIEVRVSLRRFVEVLQHSTFRLITLLC